MERVIFGLRFCGYFSWGILVARRYLWEYFWGYPLCLFLSFSLCVKKNQVLVWVRPSCFRGPLRSWWAACSVGWCLARCLSAFFVCALWGLLCLVPFVLLVPFVFAVALVALLSLFVFLSVLAVVPFLPCGPGPVALLLFVPCFFERSCMRSFFEAVACVVVFAFIGILLAWRG